MKYSTSGPHSLLRVRNNTFAHSLLVTQCIAIMHMCVFSCVDLCLKHLAPHPPLPPPVPHLLIFEFRYVVLFFYPLDFTFVCPTEIAAFNDVADQLAAMSATPLVRLTPLT
jgi:hypothetical protein